MPKLIIDHIPIEVSTGTKVIEAAAQLGINIPRFCYHPALGSVGACRVCAVKCLEGPVTGLQMSCMMDAADGMVISTTDREAVDFRRYVIELLMLNHPHDCPVCDEGGHCLLQDTTVAGGHGLRRYSGAKRTHYDQYLGPLVQHEMNRCIQCYRCVRLYRDFFGYSDLGVMGIGSRVYFGRFEEGVLESPFSGNLGDLCPTGVFTDKPSRYKGRRWDFERSPSVCLHCSLGCHTTVSTRYREVIRTEARVSQAVNGSFICDRGRFGFYYTALDSRPRTGRIEDSKVSATGAIETARERLSAITQKNGTEAVACLGGLRSSLETQLLIQEHCINERWTGPAFWSESALADKCKAAAARLTRDLSISAHDLRKADFILLAGVDPVNEAPMLAPYLRQAQLAGARVVVVDPRPVELPLGFTHITATPTDIPAVVSKLALAAVYQKAAATLGPQAEAFYASLDSVSTEAPVKAEAVEAVARWLQQSKNPAIVCGTDVVPEAAIDMAADLALFVKAQQGRCHLMYTFPGANAHGALAVDSETRSYPAILDLIESGRVRALVMVECDPLRMCPDRGRWEKALDRLDLCVVIDYLLAETMQTADIFIPAATVFESGGLFINHQGRLQLARRNLAGGEPVVLTGKGAHPPRTFSYRAPGNDLQPPWTIIEQLGPGVPNTTGGIDEEGQKLQWLCQVNAHFLNLSGMEALPPDGIIMQIDQDPAKHFQPVTAQGPAAGGDTLCLLLAENTFATEELSDYSPCLQGVAPQPALLMSTETGQVMGFQTDDLVQIKLDTGKITIQAALSENMPADVLILPRHHAVPWQLLRGSPLTITRNQISKAAEAS